MSEYAHFANTSPNASRVARDQKRRYRNKAAQEEEEAAAVQASLVSKAQAMTKIAENMAAHNNQMLAGLEAAGPMNAAPPKNVDWLARNRANVSANRDMIGRRGQLALAKAQVMAAASAHLPDSAASQACAKKADKKLQFQMSQNVEPEGQSDDLIRAAMEEMARGDQLSLIEAATRRPPKLGRRSSGRGRGRGRGREHTSRQPSRNTLSSKGLFSQDF